MSLPKLRRRGSSPVPQRTTRARRRIRRLVEGLISLVIIAIVIAGFSQYVIASPRFHVNQYKIYGVDMLHEQQIAAVGGLTTDDSMFLFDPEEVEARIEKMAYVASCEVERAYPDMVIVRLVERVPVATLLIDNRAFEIDAEGVVLRELDPLAPPTGPLITGTPGVGYVELAQQLNHPALMNAIRLWQDFQQAPFSQDFTLSELHAAGEDELTMYFDELPFALRWGRGDFKLQALRLEFLRRKLGQLPPCQEVLDLRFDNDIVCK